MRKTVEQSRPSSYSQRRILARVVAAELKQVWGSTDTEEWALAIVQTGGAQRDLSDTVTEVDGNWE